jgi:transforming growth factor-beta-induced protein
MRSIRIATLVAAALVASVATTAAAAPERSAETPSKNIVETAVAAGQFKTLASLLDKAGLVNTLATGGPFTVFAPTDAAFAKLPKSTLDSLAANPAKLKAVLLYHVVSGAVPAKDVVNLRGAKTLNGASVRIRVAGGSVRVDAARVTTADVMASNGIIHVIDRVLIPKAATAPKRNLVGTAVAAGKFETLVSLVKQAGLAGALQAKGPFTVFAPTDAAFAKVPRATLAALGRDRAKLRAVLLYHVARGKLSAAAVARRTQIMTLNGKSVRVRSAAGTVRVGGARVTTANVAATNGVVHAIDRVLIP